MPPVRTTGVAKPKNTRKVVLRIMRYLGSFKALWIAVFVCVVLSAGAGIAGSYAIKPVLNDVLVPLIGRQSPDFSAFARLLLKLAAVFAAGAFATWANARLMLSISTRLLYRIRKDLFDRMESLPISYFDSHSHGELMSRFTNDTDTLRDMLSQTLPQLMSSSATVLGVAVMMLILSPRLSLIVAAGVCLMLFVGSRIGKKSAAAFREQQKNIGRVNGYIEELIDGQKVVKVFNYEAEAERNFAALNDALCAAGISANTYANIIGPTMGNLSHVLYAAVAIAGSFLVISGGMDIGTAAAFLQYTRSFGQPVTMISQLFSSILNALAGAERIFAVIDEIPETNEGRISLVNAYEAVRPGAEAQPGGQPRGTLVQAFGRTGSWAWKDGADGRLLPMRGDVVFDNVSFSYAGGRPVLHGISIHARPGQKIALVGSTGSGKTTVTNLLARFYDVLPEQGRILYDGIPLNDIAKDDLRRSLGMVLQDTHLFTGTILENIRYGNVEASDRQVRDAAKLANADVFIRHLADGYGTVITGDGGGISQGQRQLLAIARAAVADPPVLILDEATSSIDTRTEALVQRGMDGLMRGRTVFVIAHRLSTVRNADEIIVLEQGEIIERGSHEELMKLRGRYYRLYTGNSIAVE
ncbi:MAG: ABC transporter ATP-binding protein/permease [Treponemataceae bacterium]|nr:ABC transporter ATP-binding protein/permease [Treponemataceae bacterium]